MANTSSRTLRLLSLLQTHRYWVGEELADRLSVSVRTLRRDIDRLRDLGYPVHADRGVGGGYQLAPGASLPPLVIDDDEAVAIAVGLMSAAQGSVSGTAESAVRALAKIIQVMPARLRRQVEALRGATVSEAWAPTGPSTDPDVLVLLAQACRDDERVSFSYVAADRTPSDRRVEPRQLVSLGRRWYLVGYDLDRGDWRSFRLDRIQQTASTGVRFAQRRLPGDDAVAFVRAGLHRAPSNLQIRVELEGDTDTIQRRIGQWAEVIPIGDQRCQVVMNAESLEWATFALGVADAEITDCDSPELLAMLTDWSVRFGRAGS